MRTRNSERHKIPTIQNRVLKGGRRDIAERKLKIMDSQIYRQQENKDKKPTRGPRQVFLDKYKVSKNFEEAKTELKEKGFNPNMYGDDILKKWIDEDKDR